MPRGGFAAARRSSIGSRRSARRLPRQGGVPLDPERPSRNRLGGAGSPSGPRGPRPASRASTRPPRADTMNRLRAAAGSRGGARRRLVAGHLPGTLRGPAGCCHNLPRRPALPCPGPTPPPSRPGPARPLCTGRAGALAPGSPAPPVQATPVRGTARPAPRPLVRVRPAARPCATGPKPPRPGLACVVRSST